MKPARKKAAELDGPNSVKGYLAAQPAEVRQRLERMRSQILKAVPEAQESISYRMPTYKLDGRPLLYMAAFKAHIGLYPMIGAIKTAFADELAGYPQAKGTVRFPHDPPLPYALIGRIAKFRAREIAAGAKRSSRGATVKRSSIRKGAAAKKEGGS